MAFAISINAETKAAKGLLAGYQKQIPYATAVALTKTAKAAQAEVIKEMPRVLDRPKPFTLNSIYIKPATKLTLSAEIGAKDFAPKGNPASKFLRKPVYGGGRSHKGFENALIRAGIMRSNEYAVPGDDLRLNKYGNIPQGAISRMLSHLKASPDPLQNITESDRSKAKRRSSAFFYRPEFRGVFIRTGRRAFKVFIKFVTKRPSYRKRLKFFDIIEQTAMYRFRRELILALRNAARTAR